jgi:hypothetical protein
MTAPAIRRKGGSDERPWSPAPKVVTLNAKREANLTGTTNRIPLEEAADLFGSGRACISFVVGGQPRVEPAQVCYVDSRFVVAVAAGAQPGPNVTEVSLVIDEGTLFFDLRAISVRGTPSSAPGPADSGLAWFEVVPTKVTCWDYGRLRVTDEHR